MKNFISLLIITFALLVMSNVESKGQCASGYSSKTITLTLGNCDYVIDVCYKCEVTNPGSVYIRQITEVDSSCNNALPIDQIIAQAYAEISTGAFIYSNLCIDSWYDAPPCNGGTAYKEFEIIFNYCWQIRLGDNGYEYIPCEDNATCIEKLKYCYNTITQEYDKILPSTFSSPQTPPCELEVNEITLPSVLYGVSECFILHSVPCGIE
jgi:hypothetical protein